MKNPFSKNLRLAATLAILAIAFAVQAQAADVKIWTSDVVSDETSKDAKKELKPIILVGARNGSTSGKIVVESADVIKGLKVTASALTGKGGSIPASNVQIRYAKRWPGMFYSVGNFSPGTPDILVDSPTDMVRGTEKNPAKAPDLLPVWVTVNVPKDAKAGSYSGEITVQPEGSAEVKVKLNLEVADWTLPDPQDYRTSIDFVQSPDTLALEYNVPLWSDKHWDLIARSFRLLSPTGSRTLYVPLIAGTNLGNEQSMVRWIKKGDKYEYDYSVMDKYLDLAEKNLGKPKLVIFYV
ncbi:MAG: glycoside hydrolase domain-containing protein, partial [Deltaproteobacteria bacterium]